MKVRIILLVGLVWLVACRPCDHQVSKEQVDILRMSKINYFKYQEGGMAKFPYKTRLSYYFPNGKEQRWVELDSIGQILTDYVYLYDEN